MCVPSSISTVLVDDVVADGVEEGFDCIVVLGYGKAAAIAAVVDLWCVARHVTAHSSQARTQKGRDGAGPSSHSGPQGTQPMGRPEFRPGLT